MNSRVTEPWDPGDDDGRAVNPSANPTFASVLEARLSYDKPGSRWPDLRPDRPPRPAIVAVYRQDAGKVGT